MQRTLALVTAIPPRLRPPLTAPPNAPRSTRPAAAVAASTGLGPVDVALVVSAVAVFVAIVAVAVAVSRRSHRPATDDPTVNALVEAALTDGLTSLGNRRRLDRDLGRVIEEGDESVGFIMIDIDHFKTYNDANGHVMGDAALCQVASILAANVRPGDVVYRYGGEEFCVLLAGGAPADAAGVAERLRAAVADARFEGAASQPGGRVTISVGLALAGASGRADDLKQRADVALYAAKHDGRNRVAIDC